MGYLLQLPLPHLFHENSGGGWAELYGGEREEFSDRSHVGVPCAGTVPVPGQCLGLVLRAHNLQPLFLQREQGGRAVSQVSDTSFVVLK